MCSLMIFQGHGHGVRSGVGRDGQGLISRPKTPSTVRMPGRPVDQAPGHSASGLYARVTRGIGVVALCPPSFASGGSKGGHG